MQIFVPQLLLKWMAINGPYDPWLICPRSPLCIRSFWGREHARHQHIRRVFSRVVACHQTLSSLMTLWAFAHSRFPVIIGMQIFYYRSMFDSRTRGIRSSITETFLRKRGDSAFLKSLLNVIANAFRVSSSLEFLLDSHWCSLDARCNSSCNSSSRIVCI